MMVLCKKTISLINHYSWLQIETLSNNIGTIYFFYHTYNSSKRMKQDSSIFVLALTYNFNNKSFYSHYISQLI